MDKHSKIRVIKFEQKWVHVKNSMLSKSYNKPQVNVDYVLLEIKAQSSVSIIEMKKSVQTKVLFVYANLYY